MEMWNPKLWKKLYNMCMGYKKRIIDEELREVSRSNVMISISGVKGCGKTETAKQICKSGITIDRTDGMKKLLSLNPDILSEGGKPRLIDEWQLEPWI
jgi:predicted AAA+ superfamily ATPase